MNKSLLLIILYVVIPVTVFSQNTRTAGSPKQPVPQYQGVKKENKGLFSFLKRDKGPQLKTSEEERLAFRRRVSEAYKENAKEEYKADKLKRKEARKGKQFHGHKRPPKKRKPGKQKFCKVCRIRH